MRIAIINGAMIGMTSEPGEHVDWSEPDIMSEEDWADVLGTDVATYAAANPHMIVMAQHFDAYEEAAANTLAILRRVQAAAGPSTYNVREDWGHEDPRIAQAEYLRDFPDDIGHF